MPVAGGGMFGVTPQEVYQQQQQGINQSARDIAGMDGFTAAKYAMGQVGGGLAAPVAGMLGMKNPQMEEAQQSQDIQSQIDHSTPDGLMAGAQLFNQAGNPRMAMMYQQAAQAMVAQQAELAKNQAQADMYTAKANAPVPPGRPVLSTDDAGNTTAVWPDGTTKELGRIGKTKSQGSAAAAPSQFGKINPGDFTPESLAKFAQTQNYGDLVPRDKTKEGNKAPNLPVRALQMQDESLGAINIATGLQADLGEFVSQIDSGKLQLGVVSNLMNKARNKTNMSSEESTNLATFNSTLEKMRNDSLILNKGTQTEGDAERAWNALVADINDPDVVRAQLAKIIKSNAAAEKEHNARINMIRENYGADPLDVKPFAKGKTVEAAGGNTVEEYEIRDGKLVRVN